MKKQLIEQAERIGFKSKAVKGISIESPFMFNPEVIERDNLNYYLWMCELQKWLRDERGYHVESLISPTFNFERHTWCIVSDKKMLKADAEDTYELALQAGLLEACKLIEL